MMSAFDQIFLFNLHTIIREKSRLQFFIPTEPDVSYDLKNFTSSYIYCEKLIRNTVENINNVVEIRQRDSLPTEPRYR